ncbi:Mobile element protein [Pseudomonas chlororaphis]|uniref:Mobile element protein n=1 Tax=Pseudomonas chlororaphis TaxID=587753 RepID=A0A3G7TXN4_9PSED|nr:Mobile element protein [Pseudomonas chlororaphis]
MVYDPDLDQVIDLQPCEDAYRLYCTLPVMEACEDAQASFVIRQQSKHPRLIQESDWQTPIVVAAGAVREQTIEVKGGRQWRHVELCLHTPTDSGDTTLSFWSNLPESISASQIADLDRRRWSIEGMFQRLESSITA